MAKVSLVRGYSSLAHRKGCYAVRRARGIRVVAPDLDENEIYDFLKARKLTPCGSCLREYVVVEI